MDECWLLGRKIAKGVSSQRRWIHAQCHHVTCEQQDEDAASVIQDGQLGILEQTDLPRHLLRLVLQGVSQMPISIDSRILNWIHRKSLSVIRYSFQLAHAF